MRIPIFMVLFMIVLSMITVAFADEPQSKQKVLNDVADDLASLQQLVQDTNDTIQQYQTAKFTGVVPGNLIVTSQKAVIHKGAGENTSELGTVPEGKSLKVIGQAGDWYAVSLEKPMKGLDTAWVSSKDIVPSIGSIPITPTSLQSFFENKFNEILAKINQIKEKYKNNQYVKITGFSISLSISPSVTVDVEFKE